MATVWQKRRWSGLGKRCEVVAYIPPGRIVEVAEERVRGLVAYFHEITRPPTDYHTLLDCVDTLARSCYLQGASDTADAAAKLMTGQIEGLEIPKNHAPNQS